MNQEQQPLSTDYLDEISTPIAKEEGISLKKILIFGGGALAIVIALLIVTMVLNKNLSSPTLQNQLSARLVEIDHITKDAINGKKIKDSKLRSLNSDVSINTADFMKDITPYLNSKDIDIEKGLKSKKLVNTLDFNEIYANLEDARLNTNYDQRYAIEMNHLLTTTILLIKQIENKSNSPAVLAILKTGADNYTPLQERYQLYINQGRDAID